ncbi:MAG: hypothetical protein ACRDRK_14575 [Pseudonocardia sp.]
MSTHARVGRTIVISGGSRGIGPVIAVPAARAGRTGEGFLDVDIRTEVGVPDGCGATPSSPSS